MEINGINVLGGFALKSSQPLDARSVVDQYEDLAWLISSGNAYQGMIVYVNSTEENKGLYICESIANTGTWKRIYIDEDTTYELATADAAGLIKVSSVNSSAVTVNDESTAEGRYYPVELNSDGKAIVNVPWTDTLVWHDTEDATAYNRALEYAQTAKAYVGQIITVVEGSGENTTCKAYIIQNTNGDLVELGGAALAAEIDALIGTGII